jgi:three-Cys-motif partner protein
LIALKIATEQLGKRQQKQAILIFIEENAERLEYLKSEIENIDVPANIQIVYLHNEFQNSVSDLLFNVQNIGRYLLPSFVFIDPFGINDFSFSLVEKLLRNPKTEVFINVMVEFINRFLADPNDEIKKIIVDLYGTEEVLKIVEKPGNRVRQLQDLYKSQLSKNAKYVRYFEMRDSNRRVIYTLFFATNNLLGYVKMKEALWKVDQQTGISFSDSTNKDQEVLFILDPTPEIIEILCKHYSNQSILKKDIRIFIEEKSPYIVRQLNVALKIMENNGTICVEPCKCDGLNRKHGTFPDNCIINFLN